jgi:hypothetical protein
MWDFKFSRRRVWCSELPSHPTHPWWWRQYAPLKRWSTIILHGSTSQKATLNKNLLEKLILLLLARYATACHAITVINDRFTWCSVVISVMIVTVTPLSVATEWTRKINDECNKTKVAGKLFIFNYLRIVWKLTLQGRFSFELRIIKVLEITR